MKALQNNVVETAILKLANGADTKRSTTVVLGKQRVKPLVQVTHKQKIARLILNEMSSSRVGNATDDVYDAFFRASIRNALNNQIIAKEAVQLSATLKPDVANISFYGYGQTIMDAVCWSARNPQQMAKEEDLLNALEQNGVSKSTDLAEEIGLDQSDIAGDVEYVLQSMSITLSKIGSKLKMYNTQELYMFAPSVRDEVTGEWSTPFATNDWDEALNLMNETVERLKAGDIETELTEADITGFDPDAMLRFMDHKEAVEDIALQEVEFKSALKERKATARKNGIKHAAVSA